MQIKTSWLKAVNDRNDNDSDLFHEWKMSENSRQSAVMRGCYESEACDHWSLVEHWQCSTVDCKIVCR